MLVQIHHSYMYDILYDVGCDTALYAVLSPGGPVQMLSALQLCGASLDDYLHLLVPPIVKVYETPTNPTDVRK